MSEPVPRNALERRDAGDGSSIDDLDPAACAVLSAFFGPLVRHFAEENRATGGEVTVERRSGGVTGLFLRRSAEQFGSIFATSRDAAARLFETRGSLTVYAEHRLEETAVPFPVYAIELDGSPPTRHRFSHAIRVAERRDLPEILHLVREVYGPIDDRWFRALPLPGEVGFVAEVDGRLAGAAWLETAGDHGRLHLLSVAPASRGIGVGTDLWQARTLYARTAGIRRLVTEIAETNLASSAIAGRGGMRRIGQIYEHRGR